MAIAFKKDGAAGWRDEMGHLAMLTWPLSITNLPSLERQQKHPPERLQNAQRKGLISPVRPRKLEVHAYVGKEAAGMCRVEVVVTDVG